jgi:hypothetical protein
MWSIFNGMARSKFFFFAYDRQYEQGAQSPRHHCCSVLRIGESQQGAQGPRHHCCSVLRIGESQQGAQGPRHHTLHPSGKELACTVDHGCFFVCDRQHPQGATRLTASLLFCPSHSGVSAGSTRPVASHFTP